jgi:hypothetical protein
MKFILLVYATTIHPPQLNTKFSDLILNLIYFFWLHSKGEEKKEILNLIC